MQGSNRFMLVGIVLFVVLGIVSGGVILAQTPTMVTLNAQNDSGETGMATLTDLGNGMVRVDVAVTGAPAGVPQPMHIHEGTCANLNTAPAFPLNDLVDGKSTTEITTTLQALMASPYAINGHKSASEMSVYVFCGDIAEMAMQGTVTSTAMAETPMVEATTEMTGTAMAETPTTEATAMATEQATTEATTEATGAAETPTTEATMAPETVTTEATAMATEQATAMPAATETVTPTLPSTGGDSPLNGLIPIAILGVLVLVVGLAVRRLAQS